MITKEQFLKAVINFIELDMIPNSSGNYKIILNVAKAAMQRAPDSVFNLIKNNGIVSMIGAIDDNNNINVDLLSEVLTNGLGSDEFTYSFSAFGKEYDLHFAANDIQKIKQYM